MSLTLTWPWWYFVLLVLVAGAVAFWLYYRDSHFAGLGRSFRPLWWLLALLRWTIVALLLFLLSAPLLRMQTTRVEKPLVVWLQDESQSIAFRHPEDSVRYRQSVQQLVNRLQQSFSVRTFGFGSTLTNEASFSYRQPSTNLSQALQDVTGRFSGQPLGAIILATDGIFNQGSNPLYLAANIPVPVYTVALGDTTLRRDAAIQAVTVNRTAYLGSFFPVRAEVSGQSCAGAGSVLSLYEVKPDGQELLATQPVEFAGNSFRTNLQFVLKATSIGTRHFRMVLRPVSGEITEANNVREFYVEVLEKKQRILLLAPAPHPDLGAIRTSLESTGNYAVDLVLEPDASRQWQEYALCILYQLPAPGQPVADILQHLRRLKKPVFFVLGAQSSVSLFNQAQTLLTVAGHNQTTTDALPLLNPSFSLFSVPDALREQLPNYPPLITPFGDYRPAAGSVTFLKQKIGTVATEYPLLLFREDLHGRTAVLCGEGLWRWRLWEFRQRQQHDVFDAWLSAVVQYLVAQGDEQPFRVWMQQAGAAQRTTVVGENEPVYFAAELINDAGEYINDPDVVLALTSQEGKEYPMTFNRDGNAYSLNAGYFPQGSYTWKASTQWNNRNFTASGRLTIAPVQLEFINLQANHQLLYQISALTGGRMVDAGRLGDLADSLLQAPTLKPVVYSATRTEPLIHYHWLLALLLLLLAAEWGLRKYHGTY